MEKIIFDKDISVFFVTASSFPDGILAAHQKLHSLIPFSMERKYLGLSRLNEQGEIIYKAAAGESHEGEGQALGCETIILKSGVYLSLLITDFMKDIPAIGNAFQELLAQPDLDPEGYCVEWYINDKDVKCMIRTTA